MNHDGAENSVSGGGSIISTYPDVMSARDYLVTRSGIVAERSQLDGRAPHTPRPFFDFWLTDVSAQLTNRISSAMLPIVQTDHYLADAST